MVYKAKSLSVLRSGEKKKKTTHTHTHINTLCWQNVELLNIKPGGT